MNKEKDSKKNTSKRNISEVDGGKKKKTKEPKKRKLETTATNQNAQEGKF